jgi:hypothetical protein
MINEWKYMGGRWYRMTSRNGIVSWESKAIQRSNFGTAFIWACIAAFLIGFVIAGCSTTPDLDRDVFPDSIRAQCVKAKAQAIAMHGTPRYPFWSVTMRPAERVGDQWAWRYNGRLVGGLTRGAYTQIGCGPRGEINYGDLLHEAGEYVTWGNMQH